MTSLTPNLLRVMIKLLYRKSAYHLSPQCFPKFLLVLFNNHTAIPFLFQCLSCAKQYIPALILHCGCASPTNDYCSSPQIIFIHNLQQLSNADDLVLDQYLWMHQDLECHICHTNRNPVYPHFHKSFSALPLCSVCCIQPSFLRPTSSTFSRLLCLRSYDLSKLLFCLHSHLPHTSSLTWPVLNQIAETKAEY